MSSNNRCETFITYSTTPEENKINERMNPIGGFAVVTSGIDRRRLTPMVYTWKLAANKNETRYRNSKYNKKQS